MKEIILTLYPKQTKVGGELSVRLFVQMS